MRHARKTTRKLTEQVILFAVGGTRFAISAQAVEEIRNLDGLRPISAGQWHMRLDKVRFTLERQGKNYFAVDANLHLRMLPSRHSRVLVLRRLQAAVLVDSIDRMADIEIVFPLPRGFCGEERQWYRGLAVIGGDVVPVVNPDSFLSKAEATVLLAAWNAASAAGAATA
jgi:hypothetical protein